MEVPVEVIREVVKTIEVPVEVIVEKKVEVEKKVNVEVPVQIIREIPVEVIKERDCGCSGGGYGGSQPQQLQMGGCQYVDVPVMQMQMPQMMQMPQGHIYAAPLPPISDPARVVHDYLPPDREVVREVPYEVVHEVTKEVPIEVVREVDYHGNRYVPLEERQQNARRSATDRGKPGSAGSRTKSGASRTSEPDKRLDYGGDVRGGRAMTRNPGYY